MRILRFSSPALLLFCVGCAGVLVVRDQPGVPVVVAGDHPRGGSAANLSIPPGHLPPPGECRIWFPGRPPGHQPPPQRCSVAERELPAGAWLLYRPKQHPEYIHVNVCHTSRPAVVVAIRVYEAEGGRFVREEEP